MPAPQRTPPPQQPSGPTYEEVAAALAGGTVASGVAAGAPGAAGAASGALSAEAAAKTSQTILSKILGLAKVRWNRLFDPSGPVVEAVKKEYPNRPLDDVMKLVDDREREFEREFRRKMRKRLEADVPEALSHPDPDVRARKLANIFRREMRYTAMREEAILSRAMGALEADMLQTLSPKGAYWKLSPHVKEHTLDCLAMGEKFWPWSVLRKVQPPLHYGCPCALLGLDEVIEMGLMTANQVPDEADARARYGRIADKIDGLRNLDEAIIEELYAAAYENLDVEEAAVRKPLRWAKGLIKGGQFRPTRGGSVGARTTRGIPLPESPTKQRGAARGRWTWVGGTYTKVPEADSWTKTVGERTYHSPAGGTNLYANGQLINEPGQTGNPAERVKASAGTIARPIPPELAAKVDSARSMFRDAAHPGRGVPPVAVGDGPAAVMNLRDAGYVPVDAFLVGSSRHQVWRSPEGKADIEIGAKGVITRVVWEPAAATRDRVALSRPAYSWEEHASDALAYADELGDKYKADVKAPTFEADLAMEDHAGTHLWTGEIKVGGETPVDVERAGIARREGNPLSEDEKRGVYASYWVTGHELSHAINPITPYLFSDPVEASLEEALAEEMGHKLALDRLASHGQYDVIDWRFKNPNALAVRGVYPNERFALQTILDEAGVPQRDRASVMEKMCFRMSPDSRLSFLATLHAGNTGGDTMASRNRIAGLLADPKRAPQDFRSIINPDSLRQGIPAQYGLWDHEPKGTPGNWFANEDGLNQATAMIQNSPTGASTVGDGVPVVKYGDGSVGVGTPHGSSNDSLTYAPNAAAAAEIALMRSDYAAVYANDYKASKRRVSDDKPTTESPAQKASKRALAARKANPESPGTVPDPSFEYAVKVARKMDKRGASTNEMYIYGHVNAKEAKSIGELINQARVSVRVTSRGLSSFLKSGVMLTSMDRGQRPSWRVENNEASAQNDNYLPIRGTMEAAMFGGSPVYGYFRDKGGSNQDKEAEFYGGVIVELKPQVKDRTTWTIGDSLNTSKPFATVAKGKDEGMALPSRGGIVPSPVGESSPLAVAILGPYIPEDLTALGSIDELFSERDAIVDEHREKRPDGTDRVRKFDDQSTVIPEYSEAQIHGSRPTTDEVARVIFQIPSDARSYTGGNKGVNVEEKFGPNASQAKALDKAGIPWEVQRWGGKVVKRGKTDYVEPDQTAWERSDAVSWPEGKMPAVLPSVGGTVESDQIEGAPIGSRIEFIGTDGKPVQVERRHYGWFLADNPDFTFTDALDALDRRQSSRRSKPNGLIEPYEIQRAVGDAGLNAYGGTSVIGRRVSQREVEVGTGPNKFTRVVMDTEDIRANTTKGATWSALPPVSYSSDSLPEPPQSPGWGWFSKDEQKVEKSAWAGKGKQFKPQPPPKPKVIGGKMGVSEYNGTPFPDYDGTRLTLDKPAGGSNGAMWANDDAGNKWLVKTYRGDEDRIATELVANRVYDLMGAKVAKAGTIEVDGKKGLTYQALDGKPQNGVFKQNGPNAQMGEHYMTDALLANWDFAGLTDDNVLWDDAGNPIRVDQGGTLEFRAMGQQKPFGPIPTDVWTMIRKGQAKRASLVSEDQMREQAGDIVARLTPQEIDGLMDTAPFQDDAMRERVRENLKARVEWMGAFSRGEVDLPQIPQGQAARDEFAATQDFEAYPEELVALEFYSRGGFLPVQKHLRSKTPKEAGSTDVNNAIASLDALLRDAKTKEDLIVYVPLTDPLPDALRGKTVEERSYIHASTDASDESMIRLLVPAGSHVLSLRELDGTPAEAPEIVIRRGSRIKITDLRDDGTADATLLPPAPKPYKPSFAASKAQKPSSKGNGQMKFPEPPQSPGTVANIERARVKLDMVQRRIKAAKRPTEDDLRAEKAAEEDLRTAILNDANARGQDTPPASQGTNANLLADAKKLETLSVGRSVRLSNGKSYTYDQSPTADDPFYVLTAKDDGSSRSIYAGITNTLPTEREWRQESERGTLLRPSQELRTKRLLTPSPASPGTGTSDNKPYGTGWEMFDPRGAEGILDDLIAPKPKEPKSKSALDWQTSDSAVPAPRSPGTAPTLTETLTQFASLMGQSKDKPEGWKYGSLEELILAEGILWDDEVPQPLPESAAAWKGEPKQCYKNAADAVLGMDGKQPLPDARYVEGYVHVAGLEGLPIAHAWVVDKEGTVLELTLNEPGTEYVGIEVPNDLLAETLLRRGSYGVFDDWQAGFPFLERGMPPLEYTGNPPRWRKSPMSVLWHVTDNPDFTISPQQVASTGNDYSTNPPGIFLTDSPDDWGQTWERGDGEYQRPYVAEVLVPRAALGADGSEYSAGDDGIPTSKHQTFVDGEKLSWAQVRRVMTFEQWVKEADAAFDGGRSSREAALQKKIEAEVANAPILPPPPRSPGTAPFTLDRGTFDERQNSTDELHQPKPFPGELPGPLKAATNSDELAPLWWDDAESATAENFDLNTVTPAQIKKWRKAVYDHTQESLRFRGLPEEFVAYRYGDLRPMPTNFSLYPGTVYRPRYGGDSLKGDYDMKQEPFLVRREDVVIDTNAFFPTAFVGEHEIVLRDGTLAQPLPPQSPGTAVSPLANVSVTHEEGASHLSIKGWPDDGSVPTYGTQTNTTNDGLNSETLFAVENDEYIGYLEYAVGQGKDRDPFGNLTPEQREAVVVYVEELSVAPSQQRRGVATTLMATLHERYPGTPINHGNRTNDGRAWADATLGGAEVTMDGEPLPPQSPGTKPKGKYASLVPDSMREAADTAGVTIENPGRKSRLLWALGKDKQPTGKAAEWTPALANAAMQDQKFYEDAGAAIAAMGEQYPEVMGFLTSLSWVSNPSLIPGYSSDVYKAMTNFGAAFIRYGDDEAKIAFNDTHDKSPGAMLLITSLSPASQTGYGEFLHEFGHAYAEVHGDMNDRLGLVGKYDFAAEEDFDWMEWSGESLGWDLLAEHFNLLDVMDVSDYGSTNANEAFAEMFAMHHHPDFDLPPELDAQFEKFLAAMKAGDLSTLPAPPASPGTSDGRLAALAMSEADARATLTGHGIKVGERDPAKSTDEDELSWLGAMAYLTDLFPEAVNYLGEVTYASSPTLADSPIEGGTRAGTLAGGLRRSAQAGNWAAIITRNEKWHNPNLSGLGNHRGKIIFNDLRKGSDWAYLDNFDEGRIIKIGGKSELAGRWKRLADGWGRQSDPSVTATSEELHRAENEGFTVMSGPLNSADATAARAVHEFGHALAESWYGGSALSEQLPETIKGQAIREAIQDKNPEAFEAMPYGLFWAWTDKIKRYTGGDIGWRVFRDAGITTQEIANVSKYAASEPSEAFSELLAAHYLGLLPEDVDAKFAALLDTMRGAQ